jgi:hypothetical protein
VQLLVAQMPDTDVWLFKLEEDKSHALVLKEGKNLTARKGYDNQPSFSNDGKHLYYSSVREDEQSDIYVADTRSGKLKLLQTSKESEYSPRPYFASAVLSSVVVEKDSAQRIHFVDALTGVHTGRIDVDSVGYHCFVNEDTVAYFKLTEPQSLRYYVRSTGEDRFICAHPIRSIRAINRHTLLFGIKDSLSTSYYRYDFFLRSAELLASADTVSEDVDWNKDLGLIRSEGSRIMRYEPTKKQWETLYDLKLFGITTIARFQLDVKHKQLAVVQVFSAP